MSADSLASPPRRLWTRAEYHRAGELGLFGPEERLELIAGEVIRKMTPQHSRHASGVQYASDALRAVFSAGFVVRVQLPLAIGTDSEPEPDVAVVRGKASDYVADHPTTAVLVVEVADSTVRFDRTTKANLYASAGVPEYWVVDLNDRLLEVRRNPAPKPGAPFSHEYTTLTRHGVRDTVSPLAAPHAKIAVADLIP